MNIDFRLIATTMSCLAAFNICPTSANAAEGGTATYLLGNRDSMAGALPPPGTYLSNDFQYYSGATNAITMGGVIAGSPDLEVVVYKASLTHVSTYQIFGASLGFNITVPFAKANMDISGGIPSLITGQLEDSEFGMGDITFSPVLGWHSGKFHTSLSASFYLPVGKYDTATVDVPSRSVDILSIGKNRFAFDPTLSVTYLDPDTGFELSGALGVTISAKNTATDYQTAPELHLEGTIAQHLPGGWVVGVAGQAYQQLGDDSGSGADSTRASLGAVSLQARVFGLGPVVTYATKIGEQPVSFKAKYIREFGGRRRFEGESFWFSLALPF